LFIQALEFIGRDQRGQLRGKALNDAQPGMREILGFIDHQDGKGGLDPAHDLWVGEDQSGNSADVVIFGLLGNAGALLHGQGLPPSNDPCGKAVQRGALVTPSKPWHRCQTIVEPSARAVHEGQGEHFLAVLGWLGLDDCGQPLHQLIRFAATRSARKDGDTHGWNTQAWSRWTKRGVAVPAHALAMAWKSSDARARHAALSQMASATASYNTRSHFLFFIFMCAITPAMSAPSSSGTSLVKPARDATSASRIQPTASSII